MQGDLCCPGPARLWLGIHVLICQMGAVLHNGSPGSCQGVGDEEIHFKDVHIEFSQSVDVTFHGKRDLGDGTKAFISGKIMLMCRPM